MTGYIWLYRKFCDWGWYSVPCVKDVFLHLLITANFKETEFRGKTIERGQAVFSLDSLSKKLGYSRRQIETAIKKLKSTGEISVWTNRQFSVATIQKYDGYQMVNECETDVKRMRNECETDVNIIKKKEDIKRENIKREKVPMEIQEAFSAYREMRKSIKKPLTERAVQMALSKLQTLAPDDYGKQRAILNQSTFNSWQGLFPLKDSPTVNKNSHLDEMKAAMNDELYS